MTNQEAIEYLKGQIKCLKCETGIDCEKCIMPNWSKEIEIEALNKGIEALEKQETGHWIPVSERLPLLRGSYKISDDVLVTNGYENYLGYLVDRKGRIFWHYYGSDIEVDIKDNDNDVTAWMPLPEPYKTESENKE